MFIGMCLLGCVIERCLLRSVCDVFIAMCLLRGVLFSLGRDVFIERCLLRSVCDVFIAMCY